MIEKGSAVFDYIEAAELLRQKGVEEEDLAKARKSQVILADLVNYDEILFLISQGAKKDTIGLPNSVFWEDTIIVNGKSIWIEDIYFCTDLLLYLVTSDMFVEDQRKATEISYLCYAMGLQMSTHKDQVIRSYGIACKYYALKHLLSSTIEESKKETGQLRLFFNDVENEFHKIKKEPKQGPTILDILKFGTDPNSNFNYVKVQ